MHDAETACEPQKTEYITLNKRINQIGVNPHYTKVKLCKCKT